MKLYKRSSATSKINTIEENDPPSFTKWVAENMDHNIRTLTEKGTFHGMGVISVNSKKTRLPGVKSQEMIHYVFNRGDVETKKEF